MTRKEAKKLVNGVYRVFWKDGGASVAAIGRLYDGDVWMAPCNWTHPIPDGIASTSHWTKADRVVLIEAADVNR